MADLETLGGRVLDVAFTVHSDFGPGLLENVYEQVLANRARGLGLNVDRQMPVGAIIDGRDFAEAFGLDILAERQSVVEVKAVEKLAPIDAHQTSTYLRLMKLPLGLLINFDGITLKEGIKRVANNHRQTRT